MRGLGSNNVPRRDSEAIQETVWQRDECQRAAGILPEPRASRTRPELLTFPLRFSALPRSQATRRASKSSRRHTRSAGTPVKPGDEFRYVWHCHVLEHEDNEMMLPYKIVE